MWYGQFIRIPKFLKVTLNESGKRFMIRGVCCPSQGIPKCIVQDAVIKKDDILRSNNIVTSTRFIGDSKCEDLVEMFFYDSKPVYFISNTCRKVEWIKKNRKLWHKEKGKSVNDPFICLSLEDEYN